MIETLGRAVIPNFDNAMANGWNAARDFQIRL
jgi:hypothetical protein